MSKKPKNTEPARARFEEATEELAKAIAGGGLVSTIDFQAWLATAPDDALIRIAPDPIDALMPFVPLAFELLTIFTNETIRVHITRGPDNFSGRMHAMLIYKELCSGAALVLDDEQAEAMVRWERLNLGIKARRVG